MSGWWLAWAADAHQAGSQVVFQHCLLSNKSFLIFFWGKGEIPEERRWKAAALHTGNQESVWEWLKAVPGGTQAEYWEKFLHLEGGQALEQFS